MVEEVIHVQGEYYILSTSRRIDDRTRVLKHGDIFGLFDRYGDIVPFGTGELGLYYQDTRYLSRLALKLEADRPVLLSSTIRDDNALLGVDAMNTDLSRDGTVIPRGTVHLFRSKLIWNKSCQERLCVHNYGSGKVSVTITMEFDADFADIFEVRGTQRARRGTLHPVQSSPRSILFSYEGLDGQLRRTRILFEPAPAILEETIARYTVDLLPGEEKEYRFSIFCELLPRMAEPGASPSGPQRMETVQNYDEAVRRSLEAAEGGRSAEPDIFTSNEQFNDWLNRSLSDQAMMRTETPYGLYPYAGVPWFCTAFGRDGIITAFEALWFNPNMARGVLSYLAATQANAESPEQDAQPGKILHETRAGEMAMLGEVPFRWYYGSVDATPLFVMLAGAYYERSGDLAFIRSIWPNVERGLAWIDGYGDIDGDGFVEYSRRSTHGLVQQGWKDSHDSVFHADGSLAEPPIALCEVQGYVFAAKRAAALLAEALGDSGRAHELENQARVLKHQFEEQFWCNDIATYALALDGNKKPCKVRTSNPGHCLFSGIANVEHARRAAATLLSHEGFSGWGVRTVAANESRYNPMSYHNGSVWPHDNAIIAAGLARYGLEDEAVKILTGLLDASLFFDLHRLPELFCGFPRRAGESPTSYPVACAPQTWASGAILLLLEACLGLKVLGTERKVMLSRPFLPRSLSTIRIKRLRVCDASVDLLITRHRQGDVGVNVLRREGDVAVVVLK